MQTHHHSLLPTEELSIISVSSVNKCLDEVDAMELTDVEKAYAMNIFKSEIDREVFMKMKNKNVRLIWLKQQIR